MTRNITERIGPWVESAIDEHGRGEVSCWCCTPVPAPPPVVVGIVLMMWIPAAHELGSYVVGQQLFTSAPTLDEATVTRGVQELLGALRETRSESLRQSRAAQNGEPPARDPGDLRIGPGPSYGPAPG